MATGFGSLVFTLARSKVTSVGTNRRHRPSSNLMYPASTPWPQQANDTPGRLAMQGSCPCGVRRALQVTHRPLTQHLSSAIGLLRSCVCDKTKLDSVLGYGLLFPPTSTDYSPRMVVLLVNLLDLMCCHKYAPSASRLVVAARSPKLTPHLTRFRLPLGAHHPRPELPGSHRIIRRAPPRSTGAHDLSFKIRWLCITSHDCRALNCVSPGEKLWVRFGSGQNASLSTASMHTGEPFCLFNGRCTSPCLTGMVIRCPHMRASVHPFGFPDLSPKRLRPTSHSQNRAGRPWSFKSRREHTLLSECRETPGKP